MTTPQSSASQLQFGQPQLAQAPLPQSSTAGSAAPPPPGPMRLIKADVLAEQAAIEVTLDQARRVVAEIEAQAATARQLAEREGFAAGMARALEAAATQEAARTRAWAQSVGALETALAGLVSEIVGRIVGDLPAGALAARLAGRALADLRRDQALQILVAPTELGAVRACAAEIPILADPDVRILPDPELGPGACVLAGPFGRIDAGLAAQLRALRRALAADGVLDEGAGDDGG